jgi:hypothetical protein
MLQQLGPFELEDLEIGSSEIFAWFTKPNLGQQMESLLGISSVFVTTHPREAYPGGATGYHKNMSSMPFLSICATFMNRTGFSETILSSHLKRMPRVGGSSLKESWNMWTSIRKHGVFENYMSILRNHYPSVIQSPTGAKPKRGNGRHIENGLLESPPLSHHILSKCGVDVQ